MQHKRPPERQNKTPSIAQLAGSAIGGADAQSLAKEIEHTEYNARPAHTEPASTAPANGVNPFTLVEELRGIITAPKWTPTERNAFAYLRMYAPAVDGDWRPMNVSICDLAKRLGISDKTARDTLTKFEDAGLVSIHIARTAIDNAGNRISAKAMNLKAGDKWQVDTTIAIAAKLPDALPALAHSDNQRRTRKANTERQREFAEIKAKLNSLLSSATCPHCGEAGHLHGEISATCGACGTHIDAGELADMIASEADSDDVEIISTMTSGKFLPDIDYEGEKFSTMTTEALSGGRAPSVLALPDLTDDAILTQADTLRWFAAQAGNNFTHCEKRGKAVKEVGWPDNPHTLEEAQAHLAKGGNAGWSSSEMPLLDVDFGAASFVSSFPNRPPVSFRRDAWPDRCKVVVRCSDPENLKSAKWKLSPEDRKPVLEILAKRAQGVIAGTHQSGATICLWTGEILTMSAAEIQAHCIAWLDATYPASQYPNASWRTATQLSASSVAIAKPAGDQLKSAIVWWCQQSQNVAAVDALVKNRAKGKYVAVRAERTPSTRVTGEFAGRRTWRDYGSNETLDDFEIYCRLNGIDKRAHKWQIVNQWREAQGLRPLNLQQSAHQHFKPTPRIEPQL